MTTAVADTHEGHDDHGPAKGFTRWLFTTNHKDIGTMYLIFSLVMFFFGGSMALIIRSELAQPGLQFVENRPIQRGRRLHFLEPLVAGGQQRPTLEVVLEVLIR